MRRLSMITALTGYGGSLIALRPHWADIASWTHWSTDPERALVDAAALAGWALAAWLFIAATLVIAAQAPSVLGRGAAGAARIVTPRAARRLLEAALGVALAVGPAGAALAGPAAAPVQVSIEQALDPVPAPIVAAAEPTFPDLDRPLTAVSVPDLSQGPTNVAPSPAPAAARHTVVAGDTLWDLAAAAAPPGASPIVITALWQQWYATNRAAIGSDPSLLLPGELLSLPGSS